MHVHTNIILEHPIKEKFSKRLSFLTERVYFDNIKMVYLNFNVILKYNK